MEPTEQKPSKLSFTVIQDGSNYFLVDVGTERLIKLKSLEEVAKAFYLVGIGAAQNQGKPNDSNV